MIMLRKHLFFFRMNLFYESLRVDTLHWGGGVGVGWLRS